MGSCPMRRLLTGALLLACLAVALPAGSEPAPSGLEDQVRELKAANEDLNHRLDELAKAVDDVAFFARLGDVAEVDKWRITGPPPANVKNPKAAGATNPVKFYTYTFVPKNRKPGEKLPLLLLPHGGVHADFTTYHVHILRELIAQGYVVVAPEYRGSTGYGKGFYQQIDYGGREVDDCHAAVKWALENFDFMDRDRVGLIGWSHGGLIVLLEAFQHPKDYKCCFAGEPVSDLVQRMGYSDDEYRAEFSAPYHIGKTAEQDLDEYQKRSPVWHVDELRDPAAHPHEHQRRGRALRRGPAPDRGAQGGGEAVRVQGLPGRARRAQHGPPRHHAREGRAARDLPLPGEVPESAAAVEVAWAGGAGPRALKA